MALLELSMVWTSSKETVCVFIMNNYSMMLADLAGGGDGMVFSTPVLSLMHA